MDNAQQERSPFYRNLRESIIILLSFLFIYTLSLVAVQKLKCHLEKMKSPKITHPTRTASPDSLLNRQGNFVFRSLSSGQIGLLLGSNRSHFSSLDVCENSKKSLDTQDMTFSQLTLGARSPVILACGFAFAMSLSALLIMPITIAANEVIGMYAGSYYLKWLDASLVLRYWNSIFTGCNLCLYLFMPFAYFFSEAEEPASFPTSLISSRYPTLGLTRRLQEATLVVVMIICLLYAFSYSIRHILDITDVSSLVVLNGVSLIISAIICLKAGPRGIELIFSFVCSLPVSPYYRKRLGDTLDQIQLEEDAQNQRLMTLSEKNSSPSSRVSWRKNVDGSLQLSEEDRAQFMLEAEHAAEKEKELILGHLNRLRETKSGIQQQLSISIFRRNLLFVALGSISVALFAFFVLQLLLNVVKGIALFLTTRLIPDWLNNIGDNHDTSAFVDLDKIEQIIGKTSSFLGIFGTILELMLVLFFCAITLLGAFWPSSTNGDGTNQSLSAGDRRSSIASTSSSEDISPTRPELSHLKQQLPSTPITSIRFRTPNKRLSSIRTIGKANVQTPLVDSRAFTNSKNKYQLDGSIQSQTQNELDEELVSPSQWLLMNLALLLLLSSSLPILVRFCGITRFDPLGYYALFSGLKQWTLVSVIYKSLMLLSLARSNLRFILTQWLSQRRIELKVK